MSTHSDVGTSFRSRIDRVRSIDAKGVVPEQERHRHSIKDVAKGGAIRLEGHTYLVAGVSRYVETNDTFSKDKDSAWYELRLVHLVTGAVAWVEWEEDDELVISLTLEKLSFAVLSDDEGGVVDEDDLDEMAENDWGIRLGNRDFKYADDYAARYQRDGVGRDTKGDKVYFYDFENGSETITVEEWKDGKDDYSYEIFLSRTVSPSSLTVIALGSGG